MGVKIEEQELPNNTNNRNSVEKDEISEDDNLGLIIGCAVGGVVIMAVITGLVFYFKKSPSNVVLDKFDTEANEGEDKKE